MSEDEAEQKRLRGAALKNVEEILKARQRAERELVAANEALERKTLELQQQRQWYEVTLASIGDAVITTDVDGRVTFLNPVAEVMTGWTQDEARGQPLPNVFRIVNEDTRQTAENPIEKVLASGRVVGLANHTALIARDGTERSIDDSAAPIRDASGAVAGAVMVFHDVTGTRKAERALRSSEERLRAVFSQAAIGIGVANLDGTFHEANRSFCSMLGYSIEELKKRTFLQLTHADDRAATETQVSTATRRSNRQLLPREALRSQGRRGFLEQYDSHVDAPRERRSVAVHRCRRRHHATQGSGRHSQPARWGHRVFRRCHHHQDTRRNHHELEPRGAAHFRLCRARGAG